MPLSNSIKSAHARMKALGINPEKLVTPGAETEYVSTGFVELDNALGNGEPPIFGITRGNLGEIYGHSKSGKTYVALKIAASMQKNGWRKKCAYMNVEFGYYEARAKQIGIDLDPDLWEVYKALGPAETWGEIMKAMIKSEEYDLIILDSLPALIPLADFDKAYTDGTKFAGSASFNKRFFTEAVELLDTHQTNLLVINHLRITGKKIGVNTIYDYEPTGGVVFQQMAGLRLAVKAIGGAAGVLQNDKKEIVGAKSKVEIVKWRMGKNTETCEVPIYFGDDEGDPIVDFITRITKHPVLKECITLSRNVYRYVDPNDAFKKDVLKTKDVNEFIQGMLVTEPPTLNANEAKLNIINLFDYACHKLKLSATQREGIITKVYASQQGEIELTEDEQDKDTIVEE